VTVNPIPIGVARRIAQDYGYEQVIIYARNCKTGQEHMTTYGVTVEHCAAAAKIANFLQTKIMGWIKEKETR
jgi:hypothetical protein